ncbi:MAG: efflux RND transporter periplasmic adaptor subunit [Candidatus Paceibacterota bacterium]
MKKLINIIKKHYIISSTVTVVIVLGLFFIFKNKNGNSDLFTVEKGDVVQKVVVLGKTKSAQMVDLGFEVSGRVSRVYVDVGSNVYIGQPLVSLDQSSLNADLLKAKANVASETALLEQMKKGSRPEELSVSEAEVAKAKTSAEDAKNEIILKLKESYTKSDDVLYNTVDSFFSNPNGQSPQLNLTLSDVQLKNNISNSRLMIGPEISNWKSSPFDGSRESILLAKENIKSLRNLLDLMAIAVNSQSSNSSLPQTTVDSYKSMISTARTTIINISNDLTSSEGKLNTALGALLIAEKNLALKKVGSTAETIMSQEARVLQMQAQVQSVESQIYKLTLRSPLNGVVTVKNINLGEIVTPGNTNISVISQNDLEVEANVSEISIGKITTGDLVDMTFDAFPGQLFEGTVSYIDPGETLIDGVVNYKVTIAFNKDYPEIRSGLTTNLDIKTKTKEGVLRVPQYGLIKKDDKSFVLLEEGSSFKEIKIETGLVGQDGFVEVLSGLKEGDVISLEIE